MTISVFRPPTDEDTDWRTCKVGDINDCISVEINKYFQGVGTAYFTIPTTSIFADRLTINSFLYLHTYPDSMFIIKNIQTKNNEIKLSCYDLNALLLDRLTLYDDSKAAEGTEGYDVVSGTTETCIKHYVDYNLVNPEDVKRKIPKLKIAEDKQRGLADDKYMSRLDTVDDVVNALCAGADLGYRIKPVFTSTQALFEFDVQEEVDKSASQKDRNRVIFSKGMRNITEQTREIGITADKNSFYVDADDVITSAYKDKDNVESGFSRREQYLSLSCTLEDVDLYAEKEISENYGETDSLEVEAGNPKDYPTLYDVGDIVTVYDKQTKAQVDSVISAIEIKKTGNTNTLKVILGNAKPKLLDGLATKGNTNSKNLKDNVPTQQAIGTNVYPAINTSPVIIGAARQDILKIQFGAKGTTYPILGATIGGTLSTAGTLDFIIIFDSNISCALSEYYDKGAFAKALTIPIYGCNAGKHTLSVAIKSADGAGTIAANQAMGYVIGSDLAVNNAWDGTITVREQFKGFCAKHQTVSIADITDTLIDNIKKPISINFVEDNLRWSVQHQTIAVAPITTHLPSAPVQAYNDNDTIIYLDFYNNIKSADLSANIAALEITAVIGTTTQKLTISSIEQTQLHQLKLTLPPASVAGGTVSIAYKNGNITDYATGARVEDFVIAFNPVFTTEGKESEVNDE